MKYPKVVISILSFIIVFNLSACSKSEQSLGPKNTPSKDCVATIADENITIPEYTFYLKCVKADMESKSNIKSDDKDSVKKFWETTNPENDPVIAARDKALDTVKELKILLIQAKQDKTQLEQSDLDKVKSYMDKIVKDDGGGDRSKAETKTKEKYGVSLSEYESIYKDYILAYDRYVNNTVNNIIISDNDVRKHYDENLALYDKVTVKHILILTEDTATSTPLPDNKISEKKKLAEDILSRAKSGENFESLVKQYSEDPGSKDKGGEYKFAKGEMVKEFEDWSFNAKEGDIGLVESKFGFHIIKFISKSSFDTEKAEIKHELQQNKFNENLEKWKTEKKYDLTKNNELISTIKIL